MKEFKKSWRLGMLTFLLGTLMSSSCNTTNSNALYNNYDVLENVLQEWVDQGQLIGVEVLILENNKNIFHKAYGWSDLESKIALDTGAIWTVMSMTKPFTATAILMLMEDGLLSLQDSIIKYILDYAGNKEVTIHHLLAQSSGDDGTHGNGGHNVLEFETLDAWVHDWSKQKPKGNFGEFTYSNFNYGALAYIVEQVAGMPVEKFIEDRIINPLQLNNTYVAFAPDATWAESVPSRYQWNDSRITFDKTWTNNDPQVWKYFTGALGLWMSARDYATFIQMWLNKGTYNGKQFLKPETVEMATKIQANSYGEELFGHGYGWFVDEEPLVFRYSGSAGGLGIGYPDENSVIIYLTHCSGGDHKNNFQDEVDKIWFPKEN